MPRSLPLPETSLHYNLEVTAERYPERPAILYYGTEIYYSRLYAEAERMAGFLQKDLGVRKGDRVMLYLQNSPQFVVGYYAALRAGAVIVPVNPMLLGEELAHYVGDSGARVALAGAELADRISPLVDEGRLEHLVVARYADYIEEETGLAVPESAYAALPEGVDVPWREALATGSLPDPPEVGPDDLACLPYTSGTTGRPKGCRHTHRTVQARRRGGGVQRAHAGERRARDPALLPRHRHAAQHERTRIHRRRDGSDDALGSPDGGGADGAPPRHPLDQHLHDGRGLSRRPGDRAPGSLQLAARRGRRGGASGSGRGEAGAPHGRPLRRGLRALGDYSQTHMNPPHRPKLQCLGVPAFDVDARIVDPETLAELGPGEQGEIVVSGPQVMLGYWHRPEADEEIFFERDGKHFLHTGDLGTRDEEGYFFLVDRLKRMINASGYKVWPAEVESTLYGHPAVREACVIGVPDERAGETVRTVVVLDEGHESVSGDEIVEWAKERMAAYKYPRRVEISDALPKSASGKILWRELQERYAPQR